LPAPSTTSPSTPARTGCSVTFANTAATIAAGAANSVVLVRPKGDNRGVRGRIRVVLIAAPLALGLVGCRSTLTQSAPQYIVTVAPLDVGVSPRGLCVAVNPHDPKGVWWWEPGRSGCSSRSTGPGVFRGYDARVVTHVQSALIDVHFRLQLITGPGEGLRLADLQLALQDTAVRFIPSGKQVSVERRYDLEVPEGP
jgi:hypothetical protein